MPGTGLRRRAPALWTAGLLLTSALGACNGGGAPAPTGSADALAAPVALPLSTTTPATLTQAPPVTALPVGQPLRMARLGDRREGYRYLDRGLYQEDAVEDAPPDYSFEDGGVRPWTWGTGDGARVISEPVAGGYRTYYYDAGSDRPYLVRDPNYAYAYDNGALVAAFTVAGVQIDLTDGSDVAQYGGRYFSRGHALWGRATSGQHLAVNAYAWSDRRADLAAQRVTWQRHIADNPDWSAWNSAHQSEEQAPWVDVRVQHQQAAQQFGAWQQQRFQGSPPQLYSADSAPPPAPEHHDGAAAVVGGVVAAGVVAGAVHGITGHHGAPHQTMGPAVKPPVPNNPAVAPGDHRGFEDHRGSVGQRPIPVMAEPAAPVHRAPAPAVHANPSQPVHTEPHPAVSAPPHAQPAPKDVHAAPKAVHPGEHDRPHGEK